MQQYPSYNLLSINNTGFNFSFWHSMYDTVFISLSSICGLCLRPSIGLMVQENRISIDTILNMPSAPWICEHFSLVADKPHCRAGSSAGSTVQGGERIILNFKLIILPRKPFLPTSLWTRSAHTLMIRILSEFNSQRKVKQCRLMPV